MLVCYFYVNLTLTHNYYQFDFVWYVFFIKKEIYHLNRTEQQNRFKNECVKKKKSRTRGVLCEIYRRTYVLYLTTENRYWGLQFIRDIGKDILHKNLFILISGTPQIANWALNMVYFMMFWCWKCSLISSKRFGWNKQIL